MSAHRSMLPAVRDDEGFTLIEVVVAFVVFAVIAGASITAIVGATRGANLTRDRVTAASLAQQDLQRARAVADRTSLATLPSHNTTVGTKTFTVHRSVQRSCPAVNDGTGAMSIQVTTTVTWPGTATDVSIATELSC